MNMYARENFMKIHKILYIYMYNFVPDINITVLIVYFMVMLM